MGAAGQIIDTTRQQTLTNLVFSNVDVWRHTVTNLEQLHERGIFDAWVGDSIDQVELSEPWAGTVKCNLIEKPPKNGYM